MTDQKHNLPSASSPRDLTLKQRKFLKKYLETGNATKAALFAYDTDDEETAASIGYENLRKLQIDEMMEEGGLTDYKLLKTLDEGLEANKQLAARVVVKNPKLARTQAGELMAATEQTDDFIEVPDYLTRHKYLETALKLKKRLGPDVQIPIQNNGEMTLEFIGNESTTT